VGCHRNWRSTRCPALTYAPGQTLPSEIETVREAVPSVGG
jgi:hypothetical protein